MRQALLWVDCQERCSVLRLDFKKLTMSSKSDVSHSASTRPCWFPFKLCVSFPGDLFIRCYVNALTCNSVFFDNHFWKLAISLDAYKPHDHETSWHFSWLKEYWAIMMREVVTEKKAITQVHAQKSAIFLLYRGMTPQPWGVVAEDSWHICSSWDTWVRKTEGGD